MVKSHLLVASPAKLMAGTAKSNAKTTIKTFFTVPPHEILSAYE
jgi:hypothetical protein